MKRKLINTALIATLFTTTALISEDKDMFVGASLGYTYLNIEHTNTTGAIILGNNVDESGYNYRVEGGYHLSAKVDATLNYQRATQDATHLDNCFVGLEYKLEKSNNFTPYLGAYIGYSKLTWDKNPINTIHNDVTSESLLGGGALGVVYSISDELEFNLVYTLLMTDHTTQLQSGLAKAELNHHTASSFNFGFRFLFFAR